MKPLPKRQGLQSVEKAQLALETFDRLRAQEHSCALLLFYSWSQLCQTFCTSSSSSMMSSSFSMREICSSVSSFW